MELCGMVGYYRRFAQGLADLEKPLRALTLKDAPWVWTTEHQEAFDSIKKALSSAPVLAHPDFSLMDSFIISTDASKVEICAVLSQVGHDGVERPIFICSRTTSPAESRYAPTALECLAVVYYIEVFRFYVGASTFKVRTSLYLCWILRLQPYNLEVVYRPGKCPR